MSLQRSIPIPATMWTLRTGPRPNEQDSVWAVFKSHEEVSCFRSEDLRSPALSHASHWGEFAPKFGHAPHVFRCRLHFAFRRIGDYYEIHTRSSQMISCHQEQQIATLNAAAVACLTRLYPFYSYQSECGANYNALRLARLSSPFLDQRCWWMLLLRAIWSLFRNSDVLNSSLPCVCRALLSHCLLYN
jgi:hypothetical protein